MRKQHTAAQEGKLSRAERVGQELLDLQDALRKDLTEEVLKRQAAEARAEVTVLSYFIHIAGGLYQEIGAFGLNRIIRSSTPFLGFRVQGLPYLFADHNELKTCFRV